MSRGRLRIRTLPTPHIPKGQDTIVEYIPEDGGAPIGLTHVTGLSVKIDVDARGGYVTATLIVQNVEVDLEAVLALAASSGNG